MFGNSKKIPLIKGNGIINPLIFDPEDKREGEVFNLVDENVLLNVETGRYLVSNFGRVYDTKLQVYKNPIPNCNPETAHKQPYYKTKFNYSIGNDTNFRQKDMYFHRIVAKSFIPNDDLWKTEVDHIDGNHGNNTVENLEWVGSDENKIRAIERDYVLSCEDQPNSELTNEQVHNICRLLAEGYPISEVARRFDTTPAVIQNIKSRRNYSRIGFQYEMPETIDYRNSKLPDETVHKICQMLVNGDKIVDICRTLNVGKHIVNDIKSRRNYTRISSQYDFDPPRECKALSEKEVKRICEKLQAGEYIVNIAKEMGVTEATISKIKQGKTFRYLSADYNFDETNSRYISNDKLRIICTLIEAGKTNIEIYNLIGKSNDISLAIISNIRNHKSGNHISKDFNF